MRALLLDEKLACKRGDGSSTVWRSLLSGKPTDIASLQHDGTFVNLSVQQASANKLKPTERQARAVDCNFTTTGDGGLISSALNWNSTKPWALNSVWQRPYGHDGRDVASGTLSILPKRKAACLEVSDRRAGLLGGGVSKARLEMAEGEGVFLTAGPKFRVQGGTMTLEAQTNMAHKSHLHLGLRLGKPPQLQHQSAHGKLPGKLGGLGKWKGVQQQNRRDPPTLEKEDRQPKKDSARTIRQWLHGLTRQPREGPEDPSKTLAAGLEAFQRATSKPADPQPSNERDSDAGTPFAMPHSGRAAGMQRGRGMQKSPDKRKGATQPRGGGIDAGCWLPAGSRGSVRWKANLQRELPFDMTAAIGMQTTGKWQEQRQREVRVWAPVGRGVVLSAEAVQQTAGRGNHAGLRLMGNRKGQAKWQCTANLSPSKGLQLSGKYGKEVISSWLFPDYTTDNLAGRLSISIAPRLRLSRLSFAACMPL